MPYMPSVIISRLQTIIDHRTMRLRRVNVEDAQRWAIEDFSRMTPLLQEAR